MNPRRLAKLRADVNFVSNAAADRIIAHVRDEEYDQARAELARVLPLYPAEKHKGLRDALEAHIDKRKQLAEVREEISAILDAQERRRRGGKPSTRGKC